jgi:hypothetical protein
MKKDRLQQADGINMSNARNGEAPVWWGEAPERSGTPSKEISVVLLNGAVRPENAPSRNLARITAPDFAA